MVQFKWLQSVVVAWCGVTRGMRDGQSCHGRGRWYLSDFRTSSAG